MNKLLVFISISLSKLIGFISRLTGHKGSALPGKIARMLQPNILNYLWKQVKNQTIIVTGTNGKTTTNNMIRDILNSCGKTVICNDVGANMVNGITTAFVKNVSLFGKINADFACIEVDEATLPKIIGEIIPNKIIITNIFRDQLDRYGEIDLTIKAIDSALEKLKNNNVELLLNADDPLTAQFKFKYDFKTYFYGIDQKNMSKDCEESREGRFCTFCGEQLTYDYYFYSQLGSYRCSKCGFERPELNYSATNINIADSISFDLSYNNSTEHITLNYVGFYNIYNALAAIAASLNTGVEIQNIKQALIGYKPQIGRMEKFNLEKPIILNLSKNPSGFNQVIETVLTDIRKKDVLIIINDNAQDGYDISWLWDCDFEKLVCNTIGKYYISGLRKEDMAIRLKYAGVDESKIIIEDNVKQAIISMIHSDIDTGYVLVNYTALFKTQTILKDLEDVYGVGEKK